MSLNKKQIYDLNNMNKASQNVHLGTLLNELLQCGGSGGTSIVQTDTYLEFPNIGNENILYIDRSSDTLYRWDDKGNKYYIVGFNYQNIIKISGGNSSE